MSTENSTPPLYAAIDPNDQVIIRLFGALHDLQDATLGMGQRIVALEAEINGLRGEIEALRAVPARGPQAPTSSFRPSHYSQFDSDASFKEQFRRWIEGR